jgi:hypothetical protein
MDAERKLAERFRGYASGKMVEGADLARAAAYLDKLADENERLRVALRRFLDDDRFQVAVGGNPNAIDRMLAEARAALSSE